MKNSSCKSFTNSMLLLLMALMVLTSCAKDEEKDDATSANPYKGTVWVQTGQSNFEIIGIHENGSTMAVNTNSNETSVLSVVYKSSPESSGLYVWVNSNGYPDKAYVNGSIVLFENYTESAVDIAIIRENGSFEIIRDVGFNDPDFKNLLSEEDIKSTESLADVLRWAGHGLSVAACVIEIAGAISTGGLLAPVAIIGCGAAITGIVLEFVAEDNTDIQASAAAIGAFAGAAGCISSGGLSCPAFLANAAGAVATAAESSNENLQSSIQEAQDELNQGGGLNEFKITLYKYSETENLEQAVLNEFGNNYRIADWNDIKNLEGNVNLENWADNLGISGDTKSLMVVRNGEHFYSGNRHYFIARHDHTVPSGFLVHANVDNHFIDLGSWYGMNMRVLCKKIY